jgi:hypothetical protein
MHRTISPNKFIALRYRIPESGPVEFEVASDSPVKTYVLRPKGLQKFKEGERTFKYYGGFPDPPRKLQRQKVWLPFSGEWYLVISNPDKNAPAEVDYEVYS